MKTNKTVKKSIIYSLSATISCNLCSNFLWEYKYHCCYVFTLTKIFKNHMYDMLVWICLLASPSTRENITLQTPNKSQRESSWQGARLGLRCPDICLQHRQRLKHASGKPLGFPQLTTLACWCEDLFPFHFFCRHLSDGPYHISCFHTEQELQQTCQEPDFKSKLFLCFICFLSFILHIF